MSSDTLKNGRPYCTLWYIWNGGGLSAAVAAWAMAAATLWLAAPLAPAVSSFIGAGHILGIFQH